MKDISKVTVFSTCALTLMLLAIWSNPDKQLWEKFMLSSCSCFGSMVIWAIRESTF